MKTKVCPVFI